MTKKLTRRQALIGVSSTLLLPAACSQTGVLSGPSGDASFQHGIASGDPDTTSVVIWTRISNRKRQTTVEWQVATDINFQHIVATDESRTNADLDYTVKVVVDNLEPGRTYFYRFDVDGVFSPVGRTKTLPVGHVEKLVLAIATCSNYPFGYFNSYDVIANDPGIDLVVHLGDYIYEYGQDGFGGEVGRRIGRNHQPPHETLTLEDYRQRHAQYKTDVASVAMHAKHPLIVIWDDHESANNPWMDGAQNHQDDEGDWNTRRDDSVRAFFEWMPVREPDNDRPREELWRHYKFGDLASLITLESRHTGRSKQVDIGDYLDGIGSEADANRFVDQIVHAPDRRFLSDSMEEFLATELAESVQSERRWRIIGNASVMAKRNAPDLNSSFFQSLRDALSDDAARMLDSLTQVGKFGLPVDLDSWNGYPVAREHFYDVCRDAGARDLLVLAGDSHSYWQNELYDAAGRSMGLELGSTGITSPRSLLDLGQEGLKNFDELNAAENKEVVWTEGRYRGFIRLEIDHYGAVAEFMTVSTVESQNYSSNRVRRATIESHGGKLRYV